jgi:hypothetical protein
VEITMNPLRDDIEYGSGSYGAASLSLVPDVAALALDDRAADLLFREGTPPTASPTSR